MQVHPIQRRKLYQEVLDRLMARIESGEISPGDQLPSERVDGNVCRWPRGGA